MKTPKVFTGIFLLTFLIGSVSIYFLKSKNPSTEKLIVKENIIEIPSVKKVKSIEVQKSDIIDYETAKEFGGSELLDEDFGEKEEKNKFDILETGEFHGDEVAAKTGEKWLGFFGKGKEFEIRSASIKVTFVHDEIVDGKNKKRKTGKKVSVKGEIEPMFLLKNAKKIKEGKVETLFKGATTKDYEENQESSTTLDSKFSGTYQIGGKSYALHVERVFNKKFEILFALILESENKKQILYVSIEDYLGTLYWVGDLDGDKKPDFFLSPWIKENVSESSLFISTKAKKKKLVDKVAAIISVGC